MAKRKKNRKSNAPNLPASTLERARRQAQGEVVESETEIEEELIEEAEEVAAPIAQAATESKSDRAVTSSRRETRSSSSSSRRRTPDRVQTSRRSDKADLHTDAIEGALLKPTKYVTEEDLRAEYGYVVADIRNMAILAAVLMVALVILAQLI